MNTVTFDKLKWISRQPNDGKTYPVFINHRHCEVTPDTVATWFYREPANVSVGEYEDLLARIAKLESLLK